jgi:hypothetical protein
MWNMIIDCGQRRIVSDRYGWQIQKYHKSEAGNVRWREDAPAYPATLAQACQMVAERIFKESGDTTPSRMVSELRQASHAVHKYMEIARNSA